MVNKFAWLAFLCTLLIAGLAWSAEDKLQGIWLLTHDPDGPVTEDWMLFRGGNDVSLGDAKGVYITCPYAIDGLSVVVTCDVRGKTKQVVFPGRDNFRELINPSGAIYTKQN